MSTLLHFAEHSLQEVALLIMVTVYFFKIKWYRNFMLAKERQPATGMGDTNPKMGERYSLSLILRPGEMESTSKNSSMYMQFVIMHLALFSSIGLSFIIPYAPGLLNSAGVVMLLQTLIGVGFIIGLIRIFRRVTDPYIRAISSPDDYFSLLLLTVWLAFAFLAVPNNISGGEGVLLTYFFLTAFFLLYVPFSKISHYIYYPFTRTYLGRHFGRRGVFPIRKTPGYQVSK